MTIKNRLTNVIFENLKEILFNPYNKMYEVRLALKNHYNFLSPIF
jgi:hypothetical protein